MTTITSITRKVLDTGVVDRSKAGSPDNRLINLNQDLDVRDWCKSLDCSEQQLCSAVAVVGSSARASRAQFGRGWS